MARCLVFLTIRLKNFCELFFDKVLGEETMPDTAEDALVRFAVCGVQLYGRLAVESRLYFDAGVGDTAYDVVVFGW